MTHESVAVWKNGTYIAAQVNNIRSINDKAYAAREYL